MTDTKKPETIEEILQFEGVIESCDCDEGFTCEYHRYVYLMKQAHALGMKEKTKLEDELKAIGERIKQLEFRCKELETCSCGKSYCAKCLRIALKENKTLKAEITELQELLKEAENNLICDTRGRTATTFCVCRGCFVRRKIKAVLQNTK